MSWSASTLLGTSADAVSSSSKTVTGITASVGTLVIVSGRITSGGSGLTGLTISDSSGNSWNVYQNGTSQVRAFICSTVIATGKALSSGSITVTRSGSTNITSHAFEIASYTGSVTTSWEDTAVQAFASGTGYSPTITGGAPANSGDLFITALGYRNNDVFSFTDSTGWSTAGTAQSATAPSARDWSAQSYIVNAGSGALTNTPTVTGGAPGGDTWVAVQTAFIAAGGGGDVTVAATGVSATGSVGTVAPSTSVSVTGNSATGQVGTATATPTVSATGVSATGSTGSVSLAIDVPATGVSATGQAGTVTVQAAGDVTVAVTGVQASGQVGSIAVSGGDSVSRGGHFIPLTEKQLRDLRKQERKQRKAEEDRREALRIDADSIAADIRAELLPRTIPVPTGIVPANTVEIDEDDEDLETILLYG